MPRWFEDVLEKSAYFMPHGHCYLWIPWLLWMHVISDLLIGVAYLGISLILWGLVRRLRLPFSPVFIAFGLFIGLCGLTHFMKIWTVWNPDYVADGILKMFTAAASVATAIGLVYVKPRIEEVVHAARLSEERRIRLESAHAELEVLFARVKQLDELRSQFFANVSHELRTPLALILGPAERLLADETLGDAQRRQLHSMRANGQLLLKQVNDLLDLARLEAGRAELAYVQVDAAAWFRRVASQFEVAAEQREIAFRVEAPATLPAQFDVDKLERVLINLLSNAFKFTPAGGRIVAGLADDAQILRISVADSGPGVPAAQRGLVFERFRQADGEATRAHGGTGLGLAIVREFAELHRGHAEVSDSALGGALFLVEVPARAPAGAPVLDAASAPAPAAATATHAVLHELGADAGARVADDAEEQANAHDPRRPRVLVVEDNPEMRRFVAATLSSNYTVATAQDGEEGLAKARALQPDLIVSDLMMPRMSGDQLLDALRADAVFATTPVLLLTARVDEGLRVDLLQAGAQDYLTKPFAPGELLARAGNLVQAKRAGDALRGTLESMSTDLAALAQQVSSKNRQLLAALQATEVARQQAEQANKVKGYFLGMISHELRTPLTTIDLNLQLLARDPATPVPEALRPRLDRLLRASQQMATLVDSLLEYTRVESGRIRTRLLDVDATGLAREVLAEHEDHVPAGVSLALDAPDGPLPLRTDPDLLRVVLANLLSNALKFTRAGQVTLHLESRGDLQAITVTDTGVGIARADLARIFEPFEQLEPLRRKSAPGVGLGLALVRQMVEALGGRVEVESTPGQGSRFTVLLPVLPALESA